MSRQKNSNHSKEPRERLSEDVKEGLSERLRDAPRDAPRDQPRDQPSAKMSYTRVPRGKGYIPEKSSAHEPLKLSNANQMVMVILFITTIAGALSLVQANHSERKLYKSYQSALKRIDVLEREKRDVELEMAQLSHFARLAQWAEVRRIEESRRILITPEKPDEIGCPLPVTITSPMQSMQPGSTGYMVSPSLSKPIKQPKGAAMNTSSSKELKAP